jgi:rhodanese-related sulfurtransferase
MIDGIIKTKNRQGAKVFVETIGIAIDHHFAKNESLNTMEHSMHATLPHIDDATLLVWFKANPNAVCGQDYVLIDIREHDEYDAEHVPGSLHIPCSTMPTAPDVATNTTAFVYCAAGGRSRRFAEVILSWRFETIYGLEDGMQQWQRCVAACPTTP